MASVAFAITIGMVAVLAIGMVATTTAIQNPYPLDGYIVDKAGTVVKGANITFTNQATGEVIYADSDPIYGVYSTDAGNFVTDYADGQVIQYYTVFGAYTNTTTHTIDVAAGSHMMDITLDAILDTDGDGVPDAWDTEADTPTSHWVNSEGIGRRLGDMNGDGKLSSVDALMILQIAVRGG